MQQTKLILGLLLAITMTLTLTSSNVYAHSSGDCSGLPGGGHTKVQPVLIGSVIDSTSIELEWTQQELCIGGIFFHTSATLFLPGDYNIEQTDSLPVDSGNPSWSTINVGDVLTYTITDLEPNTEYCFEVQANWSTGLFGGQFIDSDSLCLTTDEAEIIKKKGSDVCQNCQQPSIGITDKGKDVVDGGITINGQTYDAKFYYTPTELIQSDLNVPITITFVIWDDVQDNIAHIELGFGKGKIGESFAKIEKSMIWERHVMTKAETVTYDDTTFKDVSMRMLGKTNCRDNSLDNTCDLFQVTFTPIQAIVGDVVFGVSIWDDNRNAMSGFFNDGFQMGNESDLPLVEDYIVPQGTGNKSYDNEDTTSNVMTRTSPNFNLIKQYELERAEQTRDSLYRSLTEQFSH